MLVGWFAMLCYSRSARHTAHRHQSFLTLLLKVDCHFRSVYAFPQGPAKPGSNNKGKGKINEFVGTLRCKNLQIETSLALLASQSDKKFGAEQSDENDSDERS